MVPPLVVYFLGFLVLFAIALVVQINATTLSLPINRLSVTTLVFLPLAAFNTYLYHDLVALGANPLSSPSASTRRRRRNLFALLRGASQSAQSFIAVALISFLLQRVVPGQMLGCTLDGAWQSMWVSHDADGIRSVEESLSCCGYRSVADRAWPFPHGSPGSGDGVGGTCVARLGFNTPCMGAWQGAMQRSAGTELAIVLVVCLMQLSNILIFGGFISRPIAVPWFGRSRPLLLTGGDRAEEGVRRPLLPPANGSRRSGDGAGRDGGGGGRIVVIPDDDDGGGDEEGPRRGIRTQGSGANHSNPAAALSGPGSNNVWDENVGGGRGIGAGGRRAADNHSDSSD